jgi:hypothetical protein
MSSDPHWMEKAFANSHGQFKAKAKAAGKSTKAFANEPHKGKTARQANLAKTAMKINLGKSRGR